MEGAVFLFKSHIPLYKNPVSTDEYVGLHSDTLFSTNNCDLNMSLSILRLLQCWPPNDELLSEASSNHTVDAAATAALSDSALRSFLFINQLTGILQRPFWGPTSYHNSLT